MKYRDMKKVLSIIICSLLITIHLRGIYSGNYQKKVAITIDDVPNTQKYEKDNYTPLFLNILDALSIPIAIFINDGNIYDTDSVYKNIRLMKKWMQKEYILSGNHTFKHSRYSEVGLDSFIVDINRGDYFLKRLLNKD